MCIGSSEEALSHSPKNGARVDRCENTRSMTIFSGHGRSAVRSASSDMARKAQSNGHRKGRSNGNKGEAHCRNGISAGGFLLIVEVPALRGCFQFSGASHRLLKFASAPAESAVRHFRARLWVDSSLAG